MDMTGSETHPAAPERGAGVGRAPIVIALALAIMAGAAGVGVYAYQNLLLTTFRSPAFMPRDTWLMGATTLRPGLLQSVNAVAIVDAFVKQPGYDEAIKSIQRSAATDSDAQKEIVPLLDGEVSFATFGSLKEPSALVFFRAAQPDQLLRAIAKASKQPEPKDKYREGLTFRSGTGTSVSYFISSPKGWVLMGTSRGVAEQAYDRMEAGSPSLADEERFRSVMARLPVDRLGELYFDVRALLNDPSVSESIAALPAEARKQLDPFSARVAMSFEATPDGIGLHSESILDRPVPAKTGLPTGNAVSALDRLPSDTLFAFGGHNLPELMTGVDAAANSFMATSLGTSLGPLAPKIEFQFSKWFAGEFALGVGRGDLRLDRGQQQGQPDVVFTAKLMDAATASSGVDALDKLTSAKTTTVQGYKLKQVGTGQSAFLYGVADDWLYALTAARTDRLIAAKGRTDGITTAPNYALVKRVIREDGLIFYVDLENARRVIEDLTPPAQRKQYDEQVRVFLQPLRAIGGSVRTDANGDVHGEVIVAIKR